MAEIENQRKQKLSWKVLGRCMVSLASVAFTQFSLYMVPYCFPSSSLLTLLPISGSLLPASSLYVFAPSVSLNFPSSTCRKILYTGSDQRFLVRKSVRIRLLVRVNQWVDLSFWWLLFSSCGGVGSGGFGEILESASWSPGLSSGLRFLYSSFHLVCLHLCGSTSILSSDPGFVTHEPFCRDPADRPFSDVEAHSESSVLVGRVGYCKHCKAYVKGFDHHCPAFGNCIGQENHFLFMMLLAGFLISEASYIVCSFEFATKSRTLRKTGEEAKLSRNLAISTVLFSLLQVLWQVVFLIWHISCICINIKTDEWINWKNYPEFQSTDQPQPGYPLGQTRFTNPYDKGIIRNLKEFLKVKE